MPTTEILGHTVQTAGLLDDIASGNVSHAYLFSGAAHLGKFTVAKWFAKILLQNGKSGEAAESISDQVDRLIHPDLFVLDQLWIEEKCEDFNVIAKSSNIPQQHRAKKPVAKTDSISVEDVRVLQERLFEIGTGAWRCCLIRKAERMHAEAANTLLKMLEEPPQGMVFLLTTESPAALLPTILSRARVVRFFPVSRKELAPLVESVPEDEAQFLLRVAQGAPGIVQRLRDNPDAMRAEKMLSGKAVEFWRSSSLMERLQITRPLGERGEESDALLLHLALALRTESPSNIAACSTSLHELIVGFKTNAQRKLLAQRFVLSLEDAKV